MTPKKKKDRLKEGRAKRRPKKKSSLDKPKKKKKGERPKIRRKEKLHLADFERQVVVRSMTIDDFEALVVLQKKCFPGMPVWDRDHIESQLEVFPEGQIVIEYEGKLVASSGSLIVDFSEYAEWHNWKLIADSGYIRNHDPEGDTLYGIEMMVHPGYRGMRLSRRLYDARKDLCRRLNLMRIIIGGRIPGYHRFAEDMSAREYADYVLYKDVYDPVLTPQLANGFVLRALIPDYLKSDVESRGYATHLEWTNLDYVPEGRRELKSVSTVRVCCVQWSMRPVYSFDDFAHQVEFYVDVAGDYRADFIVFPELFTLELLSAVAEEIPSPAMAARHLAEFTSQYLELMTSLAVRYHVNVVGGSQFTLEDDDLYNVAYLFRRDGTLGKQYKLHITPNDRRWWGVSPGSVQEIFDTDAGRVAINVCYDVEFPELARYASAEGARLLFVPFSTDERNGYHRVRYCAQARCIENHLYAAISGCVGHLPFVDNADIHYAQSALLSPCDISFSRDGIAAEASPNIAQVLLHDLDLELVRRHRHSGTTTNWKDRRTDLYRCVFTTQDGETRSI
ncbi:MAG: GNAT family N-acetyltransferase [Myxococcales bacterium]|nr:GNAT family N-acetyltransferase [Myxococcales bacterium]